MTLKSVSVQHVSSPISSLSVISYTLPNLDENSLEIQLLYSPINPADINMCEGRYILKPNCPFVPGNEGVGKIVKVGKKLDASLLHKRVIFPFQQQSNWIGFWQERIQVSPKDCLFVPDYISDEQASMLSINPLTAYVMLSKFQSLEPDNWVIQNLANSAVGRWVIYMSKIQNIKTINIVRRKELIAELYLLGATEVFLDTPNFSSTINQKGNCKLALNGTGGHCAKEIARCLAPKGTLITYGAMSKKPIEFGNTLFIYKTITATGFNRTLFSSQTKRSIIKNYYDVIFSWLKTKPFYIPISNIFSLNDINHAIKKAQTPFLNGKILLKIGN